MAQPPVHRSVEPAGGHLLPEEGERSKGGYPLAGLSNDPAQDIRIMTGFGKDHGV